MFLVTCDLPLEKANIPLWFRYTLYFWNFSEESYNFVKGNPVRKVSRVSRVWGRAAPKGCVMLTKRLVSRLEPLTYRSHRDMVPKHGELLFNPPLLLHSPYCLSQREKKEEPGDEHKSFTIILFLFRFLSILFIAVSQFTIFIEDWIIISLLRP